jgi:hypothetical protein
MRPFIDDRKTSTPDEIGHKVTNTYVEIEIPLGESLGSVLYIIPRSEHSALIATCWDHVFDEMIENLDEDTFETIVETWPTLAILFHNGVKDLYREGALILLEDFDDGEQKWFVASIAGNIAFESAEELFSERTKEVIQVVLARSMQLFTELQEKEPSLLRGIGKGIARGIGAAIGGVLAVGLAAFLGVDLDDLA